MFVLCYKLMLYDWMFVLCYKLRFYDWIAEGKTAQQMLKKCDSAPPLIDLIFDFFFFFAYEFNFFSNLITVHFSFIHLFKTIF